MRFRRFKQICTNNGYISGQMSENEQLYHIPIDETTDQQSIHPTHESATTEMRSNFNPVAFTVLSSYQPVYVSSAFTNAELDKIPYFAAATELYNSDAQDAKYHGDNKRIHDGRISSISKYHRRHRQRLSSVLRTEHVMFLTALPSSSIFLLLLLTIHCTLTQIYRSMHSSIETRT